ncbi:MAG: hypothetical protein U5L07_01710 [Desulfobacterales bacterium]|nr:hypothetical protein [Desulfobacterales bacterium]
MLIKFVPQLKIFFGTLSVIGLVIMLTYLPARSQMLKELSDVQNGIFHLSPRNHEFTAETDKADQYIDDEQADFFIAAGKPDMELEADGNYPYSVVNHRIRDEDLEMVLKNQEAPSSIEVVYLSRHNIVRKEYTSLTNPPNEFFVDESYKYNFYQLPDLREQDRLNPPGFFIGSDNIREPINNQIVEMAYWGYVDVEVNVNEYSANMSLFGRHLLLDGTVRIRGNVMVWVRSETNLPGSSNGEMTTEDMEVQKAGRCNCNGN